jgi:hypothetical protein
MNITYIQRQESENLPRPHWSARSSRYRRGVLHSSIVLKVPFLVHGLAACGSTQLQVIYCLASKRGIQYEDHTMNSAQRLYTVDVGAKQCVDMLEPMSKVTGGRSLGRKVIGTRDGASFPVEWVTVHLYPRCNDEIN